MSLTLDSALTLAHKTIKSIYFCQRPRPASQNRTSAPPLPKPPVAAALVIAQRGGAVRVCAFPSVGINRNCHASGPVSCERGFKLMSGSVGRAGLRGAPWFSSSHPACGLVPAHHHRAAWGLCGAHGPWLCVCREAPRCQAGLLA